MAKSLNQVVLLGNLTRDPELRTTPNGMSVCSFSLALNRSYKVNDQWTEAVDYIDVVVWNKIAESVSGNVTKGSPLLVTGRLQSRNFESQGQKRNKVEVVAQEVIFLQKASQLDSMPHEKKEVILKDIDDDFSIEDIPF
jgi:single-strand DNA-binding protein